LIMHISCRPGSRFRASVPTAGFIWVSTQLPKILASEELLASGSAADNRDSALVQTWEWIPQLGVQLSFRLDTLSAFLSLIVLGVGAAVLVCCFRFFLVAAPRLV